MKIYYDFHIHTALSPCGDNDMTPNNIVGMAQIKELDAIAVTDHNTTANLAAVLEVSKGTGLVVVPGMEVETSEEVHVVCLFPNLAAAQACEEIIKPTLPPIPNSVRIYGNQYIMDAEDEVCGEYETLLLQPCGLGVDELFALVNGLGGIAIPAHIDRSSYSILSNLGFIPKELNAHLLELSKSGKPEQFEKYGTLLRSSDAHYLQDISERENSFELGDFSLSASGIVNCLRSM